MPKIIDNKYIICTKCSGRMLVDRVFLSYDYIELYCLKCGKREMYPHPEGQGAEIKWIMQAEKNRAKLTGSKI